MTQISTYLREIDKEARRNALIRNKRKQKFDEEISDAEIDRMTAHLDRRIDRTTKNKWYALSCRIQQADSGQLESFRNSLEKVKNGIRKERKMKMEMRQRE